MRRRTHCACAQGPAESVRGPQTCAGTRQSLHSRGLGCARSAPLIVNVPADAMLHNRYGSRCCGRIAAFTCQSHSSFSHHLPLTLSKLRCLTSTGSPLLPSARCRNRSTAHSMPWRALYLTGVRACTAHRPGSQSSRLLAKSVRLLGSGCGARCADCARCQSVTGPDTCRRLACSACASPSVLENEQETSAKRLTRRDC